MSAASRIPVNDQSAPRVLTVVDWDLDAQVVVGEMRVRAQAKSALFGLLVPARLHGLDWVGDPRASRPCAEGRLLELQRLCRDAGISVGSARIGDPEAVPATVEALADWPAMQILIFERKRRVGLHSPLDLGRRVGRATGLPVTRIHLSSTPRPGRPRPFGRPCEPVRRPAARTV